MGRPPLPVGTRTIDAAGYVREKVGDHPLAVAGWVRLHRRVLFDQLGPGGSECYRCGARLEWGTSLEVDHVDRDRRNNELENLRPACRSCQNAHRRLGVRENSGWPKEEP
jgi:5-methylcytosine-specific restriction endonuclease McrA